MRRAAFFRPLFKRGFNFFTPRNYSTNLPSFDQCFKIVEAKRAELPKFWNSVESQLETIKQARVQNRPLTQEEMSQIDFGPNIARIYDTDPTVEPLFGIYNDTLESAMDAVSKTNLK